MAGSNAPGIMCLGMVALTRAVAGPVAPCRAVAAAGD